MTKNPNTMANPRVNAYSTNNVELGSDDRVMEDDDPDCDNDAVGPKCQVNDAAPVWVGKVVFGGTSTEKKSILTGPPPIFVNVKLCFKDGSRYCAP